MVHNRHVQRSDYIRNLMSSLAQAVPPPQRLQNYATSIFTLTESPSLAPQGPLLGGGGSDKQLPMAAMTIAPIGGIGNASNAREESIPATHSASGTNWQSSSDDEKSEYGACSDSDGDEVDDVNERG